MKTIEERLDWLEQEVLHHKKLWNMGWREQYKKEAEAAVRKANSEANEEWERTIRMYWK